jgi:hypothetical protein
MNPSLPNYPVRDGFLLDTTLRCNYTFKSLALSNFEPLRRAGAYRSRMWTVPTDPRNITIPKYDAYEYQCFLPVGSAIWGYIFNAPQNQFSFQVKDACTDVPLWSEPIVSTGQTHKQQRLSKLLVVGNPGLLNIEICNLTGSDATNVQIILCGGIPVEPGVCA